MPTDNMLDAATRLLYPRGASGYSGVLCLLGGCQPTTCWTQRHGYYIQEGHRDTAECYASWADANRQHAGRSDTATISKRGIGIQRSAMPPGRMPTDNMLDAATRLLYPRGASGYSGVL